VRHIVHVTECLAGGTLGVLTQAIAELAQIKVRQTLVYSRRPDTPADVKSLFPSGLRLIELAPAQGRNLEFASKLYEELRALVRDDPPDVVHLHSSKAGFVGRLALRALGSRAQILYSPHGLAFLNLHRPWSSAGCWILERLAGFVDCQPVSCGASEARMLATVTRRPAFVIENPVDPEFFNVARREAETPLVVMAGRICEQKAPEIFAEVSIRVRLEVPDARFVWIGAGDAESEAMLHAVGVDVTGWLPQSEVREWLARASVYLQTSRWEGLPLSVLQATAVGLPCVVLNAVGNRDAVVHQDTGYIGDSTDDLSLFVTMLLNNPALRLWVGRRARERAERRFTRERFRAALLRLYQLDAESHEPGHAVTTPATVS